MEVHYENCPNRTNRTGVDIPCQCDYIDKIKKELDEHQMALAEFPNTCPCKDFSDALTRAEAAEAREAKLREVVDRMKADRDTWFQFGTTGKPEGLSRDWLVSRLLFHIDAVEDTDAKS